MGQCLHQSKSVRSYSITCYPVLPKHLCPPRTPASRWDSRCDLSTCFQCWNPGNCIETQRRYYHDSLGKGVIVCMDVTVVDDVVVPSHVNHRSSSESSETFSPL